MGFIKAKLHVLCSMAIIRLCLLVVLIIFFLSKNVRLILFIIAASLVDVPLNFKTRFYERFQAYACVLHFITLDLQIDLNLYGIKTSTTMRSELPYLIRNLALSGAAFLRGTTKHTKPSC